MKNNPIQFAVVREDPWVQYEILKNNPPQKMLMVASGGCSALSLQSYFPETEFDLLDMNSFQINLVKEKVKALQNFDNLNKNFDIGEESANGLSSRGNFESLFRQLRLFIFEFIAPYQDFYHFFTKKHLGPQFLNDLFCHNYWPVADGGHKKCVGGTW